MVHTCVPRFLRVKRYPRVEKVFVWKAAEQKCDKETIGYSILLRLHSLGQHRYVFIGWKVYEFTAPEEITGYYSLVENSNVDFINAVIISFGETNK